MKHKRFIIKIVCFAVLTIFAFQIVNQVLKPKFLYDNDWPMTQTFTDFYDLEENSVDVLFLGSSHFVSTFSPLELYETYGISSYNLGSEQQNLLISYYWLKEALKYQSPQVVVVDTYLLFTYRQEEALNSAESTQRKAIDYMKWSDVKREAISAICKYDENQTLLSYYFTNIRFHTRWTGLNEDDFKFGFTSAHEALMGYSALNSYCNNTSYQPIENGSSTEVMEPVEVMQEYLDKIVKLCKENDIALILANTPCTAANIEKYNYVNQYAAENSIEYIDFNEKSIYSKMDYNFATDNRDNGHLNIWGAQKVNSYFGDILVNQYNVNTGENAQYEQLLEYYAEIKEECELSTITDFYQYLECINSTQYVVFISIKDEGTAALDDELKQELASLGTTADFNDAYRYSYYAVINGDAYDEEIKDDELSSNGTIRNGIVTYEISSAGKTHGNKSSIIIKGKEYSKNSRGMNIVVYSLNTKKVIDSVCFDTYDGLTAKR